MVFWLTHGLFLLTFASRDFLRGAVLDGHLRSQRAHAAARARITEALLAEQQAIISNLWRVLAMAGCTPGRVRLLPLCQFC